MKRPRQLQTRRRLLRNQLANQQVLRPALQLGSAPPESPQQNRVIPEGDFVAFVATTTALSAASFCSDETVLTMMVDSGATPNFVDPFLTPRLKEFMRDYRVLNVSQNIVGIGENVLKRVATGIVQSTDTDDGGHEREIPLTLLWCQGWDPTYSLLLRQCRSDCYVISP